MENIYLIELILLAIDFNIYIIILTFSWNFNPVHFHLCVACQLFFFHICICFSFSRLHYFLSLILLKYYWLLTFYWLLYITLTNFLILSRYHIDSSNLFCSNVNNVKTMWNNNNHQIAHKTTMVGQQLTKEQRVLIVKTYILIGSYIAVKRRILFYICLFISVPFFDTPYQGLNDKLHTKFHCNNIISL